MENDKVINCLMELLKGENFMSADYTNIALQNGTNLNVLREIYLCACDKISVKDVQEVIDNRKSSGQTLRRQLERSTRRQTARQLFTTLMTRRSLEKRWLIPTSS